MGTTFITLVTVILLIIEGDTQGTREDLIYLGSQELGGSYWVTPHTQWALDSSASETVTLSCDPQTLGGSQMQVPGPCPSHFQFGICIFTRWVHCG